jgi:hypothetical protein
MDSKGRVVMESILGTKATVLELLAGLRGSLSVDLRRRHLGGLARELLTESRKRAITA